MQRRVHGLVSSRLPLSWARFSLRSASIRLRQGPARGAYFFGELTMGYKVAVAGATGNVGREMLAILAERAFPADEVVALASRKSMGQECSFGDKTLKVKALDHYDFSDVDICLMSAGGAVSKEWSPKIAAAGAVVIDNSSAWRMDPDVPLIVPEVNADALAGFAKKNIIANPNCSTAQLVVALKPPNVKVTPGGAGNIFWATVYILLVFGGLSVAVIAMNWLERKILAHMQVRLGPMRVGPHGLLQPIADAIKLLLKEDIIPAEADKIVFWIAPFIVVLAAFTVFVVVPFGPTHAITDMNIGILFMLGVSSLSVLGIVTAGWASNSHYPLIGALRSSAQMVSYEVAMGLAVVSV